MLWEIKCYWIHIESKAVDEEEKKGIFKIVQKIQITGEFIVTDHYELIVNRRGGEITFSARHKVRPLKEKWLTLKLSNHKPTPPTKWEYDGRGMNRQQAEKFLARFKIPASAISALLASEPEKKAG